MRFFNRLPAGEVKPLALQMRVVQFAHRAIGNIATEVSRESREGAT